MCALPVASRWSAQTRRLLRGVSQLGLADISLTSNAQLLTRKLPLLLECGIRRLNISLDTLDAAAFLAVSPVVADLATVLDGLQQARAAGYRSRSIWCRCAATSTKYCRCSITLGHGFELRFYRS